MAGTAHGPPAFKYVQHGWEPALREAREFKSGVETPAFTQARADWESAPQMARGPVRSSAVAPTRLISDPGRGGGRGPRASCARQVYSGPVCSSGPVGGPELGRGPDRS